MGLKKKKMNIIIFGATGAIGNYLLRKYLNDNHRILVFVKNNQSKQRLINKIKLNKDNKITIDLLDNEKKKLIKKKLTKHALFIKNSDLIINASGILGEIKSIENLSLKNFQKTLDINFISNLIMLQTISKFIDKKKKLSIIFFSGGGVTSYRQNFSGYSISKLALVKLVEIASKEMKEKFIQINAIAPGIINSKMTKITLKNKKLVSNEELKKIKHQTKLTNETLDKLHDIINFLISSKGKMISGKLISSKWDGIEKWNVKKLNKLIKSDLYSIRRIQ